MSNPEAAHSEANNSAPAEGEAPVNAEQAPAESVAPVDTPAPAESAPAAAESAETPAPVASAPAAEEARGLIPASEETPWYEHDDVEAAEAALVAKMNSASTPQEATSIVAASAAETLAEVEAAKAGPESTVAGPPASEIPVYAAAPTQVYAPAEPATTALTPPELAAAAAPAVLTPSPQPIFVQAPLPPTPRGNRGAAGLIGLVAALAFALAFFAVLVGTSLILGVADIGGLGALAVDTLKSATFWVSVVAFYLGFWLLGAFVNRGRWGYWVIFGIIVGAIAFGGVLLGVLVDGQFWNLTGTQASRLVQMTMLSAPAIAAFVLGREVTIWFGAWAARRGRKVTAQNEQEQAEYERALEDGPQLFA